MLLLRLTGPHSEIAWPYTYAFNVQVQVHLFTLIQSGSARVFGYTAYKGFLNRVFGISLSLNFGYKVYLGIIWVYLDEFWVFLGILQIFFG